MHRLCGISFWFVCGLASEWREGGREKEKYIAETHHLARVIAT